MVAFERGTPPTRDSSFSGRDARLRRNKSSSRLPTFHARRLSAACNGGLYPQVVDVEGQFTSLKIHGCERPKKIRMVSVVRLGWSLVAHDRTWHVGSWRSWNPWEEFNRAGRMAISATGCEAVQAHQPPRCVEIGISPILGGFLGGYHLLSTTNDH